MSSVSSSYLTCRQRGEWFVVGFNCERLTDAGTIDRVGRELSAHLRDLPLRGKVVITFEGVEQTSSALISLLNSARAIVVDRLGELALCRVGPHLREMLRLTKLDQQFEIRDRLRDVVGNASATTPRQGSNATVKTAPGGDPQWID